MVRLVSLFFLCGAVVACFHGGSAEDPAELEGSWQSGCFYGERDGLYRIVTQIVEATHYMEFDTTYSDSSCTLPQYGSLIESDVVIGPERVLVSGFTVKEIDLANIRWQMNLLDEALVADYNANSTCLASDWELEKYKDVTECEELNLPRVSYQVFKVDGDNLFWGDMASIDANSSDKRPKQLDDIFFERQR